MRVTVLFYVSLVICAASFVLFAVQVCLLIFKPAPKPGGIGAAQAQSFDPVEAVKEVREMAHVFAKAGPTATSAALCVVFGMVALLASGLVKLEG